MISCSFFLFMITVGEWGLGYIPENILVIYMCHCRTVGDCAHISLLLWLISIFISIRWQYTISYGHDLGVSRYANAIISSYEGNISVWATECTFRAQEEPWDLTDGSFIYSIVGFLAGHKFGGFRFSMYTLNFCGFNFGES